MYARPGPANWQPPDRYVPNVQMRLDTFAG
jgi:hypothetical protein